MYPFNYLMMVIGVYKIRMGGVICGHFFPLLLYVSDTGMVGRRDQPV